jgi:hypothetical protein
MNYPNIFREGVDLISNTILMEYLLYCWENSEAAGSVDLDRRKQFQNTKQRST